VNNIKQSLLDEDEKQVEIEGLKNQLSKVRIEMLNWKWEVETRMCCGSCRHCCALAGGYRCNEEKSPLGFMQIDRERSVCECYDPWRRAGE
jgi:hypothetical protein